MNKKRAASKAAKRPAKVPHSGSTGRLKTVVQEKVLRGRVREMARKINRDYAGRTLHVVGVLEDGFVFVADLVRALTVPVVCYFVRPQVRDSGTGSEAIREILYIPPVDAKGKDLLLVEGVVESGLTLDQLCQSLLVQHPASLRIAALIDKLAERKVDIKLDYSGFRLSGHFLVGYGLGFKEQFRNLPYLAEITQ